MALEISELTTLCACFYRRSKLNKIKEDSKKDLTVLEDFLIECKNKIATNNSKIKYGAQREQFIEAMDPDESSAVKEMAVGVSGALAIKDWLFSVHNEAYDALPKRAFLTGNVWPKEVLPFRIENFGVKDYNSSDMIVYMGEHQRYKYYYGISLKKKDTVVQTDPTLINKVFSSVLEGDQYKELFDDIIKHRKKFFVGRGGVLFRAARKGKPLEGSKITGTTDSLWARNFREPKSFEQPMGKITSWQTQKLINLRGHGAIDTSKGDYIGQNPQTGEEEQPFTLMPSYVDSTSKRTDWHMRSFVNKELSKGYFDELAKVLDDNAKDFATGLINIILKPKLPKILEDRTELNENYFGFALVTGVGTTTSRGANIGDGNYKDIETILCGLSEMERSRTKYTIKRVANPAENATGEAAKVFYDLKKGRITILHLELRFKGDFTQQPQFQAKLADDFKDLLNQKCPIF